MPFHARLAFRRRTVWLVLAAWMFALAAGVANACLLTGSPRTPAGRDGGSTHHPTHHAVMANAGDAAHAADGPSDPAHTPCKKFCDDEATTIKHADPVGASGPLALCSPGCWLVLPAPVHRPTWSPERALPPDIPVAIRFLRLTI